MRIEVVKQKRKTIALKFVDSKTAILKVPLSYSQKKIQEFLQSKAAWIDKTVKKLEIAENFANGFQLDKNVYFFGKNLGTVEEVLGCENLSTEQKSKLLKKFYNAQFPRLVEVAEKLSEMTGLKYEKIKPTTSRCVWGSFSSAKVMKLNWKLILLPAELVSYVVVHELCHGLQMNHSKKFWQNVGMFLPDYKKNEKELSSFAFVLKKDF